MKEQISQENKARFFAQYYDQEVYSYKYLSSEINHRNHFLNEIRQGMYKEAYLVLKPLFSISEEDSEIFRSIMRWPAKGMSVNQTIVLLNDEMFPAIAIDFLRSKGYALSWMGLSIDKMIEAGWIKLKP